jgi:hypothetical protein
MTFEFFKAFPADRESAVVELNVRTDGRVDIPAEVRREDGQLRIAIFGKEDGIAWDYPLQEWIDALTRAAEILEE